MKDVEAQLIHEMQNSATVLREAASQLQDHRGSMPESVQEHLTEMMARRSGMLVRLLSDLSTSHLADRGELELSLQRVSLRELCQDTLAERVPVIGHQITLDLAEDAVAVADPMRLTQVLDNLVTNALRYGGPNVHVSAERVGTTVCLSVSDDGSGVPEELIKNLFEAYVHGSSSRRFGGSGLGLMITRQLCEAMNGSIRYDGSAGTRFTATFPALAVPTEALDADVAGAGHAVAFWHVEASLAESLLAYVGHGLSKGEAVVVCATRAHHQLLEQAMAAVGIDVASAISAGQYLPLDATSHRNHLPLDRGIDRDRFEATIGRTVEEVSRRWRRFRVFGEIVDLYWRSGDDHLALDLEACWRELRARVPFPLLCGYELAPGDNADALCACHDLVVSA